MQVKRFVAPSMRTALKMVREEVGEEAVILSNKRVPEGVEIMISIDEPVLDELPASISAIDVLRNAAEQSTVPAPEQPATEQTSKLQQEVVRMQREARQRAESLAAALAKKSQQAQGSFADLYSQQVADQQVDQLGLESDDVEVSLSRSSQQAAAPAPVTEVPADLRDEELNSLRSELQSMRDMMEMQFSNIAWGNFSQNNPRQANLWRGMKRMGLQGNVIDRILRPLPLTQNAAENWQRAMVALSAALPAAQDDVIAHGGIFAFVGPTGVGKTTTIAKLAARYVLKHGAEDVALVTMDSHRLAAFEQLRTLGRILNVPVKMVDKAHSLEQVLHSLRHKRLVLIDTAGLNRGDQRLQAQLQAINELGARAKTLLVTAATAQGQVIKSAYDSYKTDNLAGGVLTKLDESFSLGESFSLMIEKCLPVLYTTNGQDVPDDIAVAKKPSLVKMAIQMAKAVDVDEQDMAEELAAHPLAGQNNQQQMQSLA
jgi:flagellar biosynthesis protein FlhF